MTGCRLEIRNLEFSVDGKPLLEHVSFAVEPGELCCLIGPNGAGKSTLLKCIDRLHAGWTGQILLDGTEIADVPRRMLSRQVGYVPQCRELLPDFMVGEFLAMSRYAQPGGAAASARSVRHALERVGLAGFEERRLGTLSGGECQKAFIAAGLVQETPLLLLDEPTAFLDPRYQGEINGLLYELSHADGVTVLCVSHDLNSSLLYGDRLVGLKEGRVAFASCGREAVSGELLEALFDARFSYGVHPGVPGTPMVLPREPRCP